MKSYSAAVIFRIFLGIGLLLLVISGIIFYNVKKFSNNAATTTGQVVDLVTKQSSSSGRNRSVTYAPVVIYSDAANIQHRYISSVSSNPPGYSIGETVKIYYNPNNPDDAMIAGWGAYLGAFITGGIGLLFSLIGGSLDLMSGKSKKKMRFSEEMMQIGQRLQTDIVSVDPNKILSVNNRHAFMIRSAWKDPLTGQTRTFVSNTIWFDPTPFIPPGKKIDVYIHPRNPGKYYMDISAFKK